MGGVAKTVSKAISGVGGLVTGLLGGVGLGAGLLGSQPDFDIPAPPAAPEEPEAPPATPDLDAKRSADVRLARERARKQAAAAPGRSSTILTSAQGVTDEAQIRRKTLLGQ